MSKTVTLLELETNWSLDDAQKLSAILDMQEDYRNFESLKLDKGTKWQR